MKVVIDEVFKFKDDFEEIFLFTDKKKEPKLEKQSMKTKIIGDKNRDNLFIFESKSLYLIKTKTNYCTNIVEYLSELGFIVNFINKNGLLFIRIYNPSNNTIFLSFDAVIAETGD